MKTIGVDIGGMSVKIGLVSERGKIIYKTAIPTRRGAKNVVCDISKEINKILEKFNLSVSDVKGIGIGSPGLVSSKKGMVACAYNLKWINQPICEMLKQSFDTQIKISNDANCAVLGEVRYGCAKKYKDVVMLTLGTGIGGGVVIDGKLFEGGYSQGAELGHVTLVAGGEQCTCGRRGCIEAYASATALIRQTKQAMQKDKSSLMWQFAEGDLEKVNGKTAFECSKLGDESAKKVCDTYVSYIADGIMSFCNIFRPQAFIIGGGVSAQGDYLINKIKDYCVKYNYGFAKTKPCKLLIAKLKNDAGIIGAAALIE